MDPNQKTETIKNQSTPADPWYVCLCGNTPEHGGFGACDLNGDMQMEEDGSALEAWHGQYLRCLECHRYFGIADLVVAGHKLDPAKGSTLTELTLEYTAFQYQQHLKLGEGSELPRMDLAPTYQLDGEHITQLELFLANDFEPEEQYEIGTMPVGSTKYLGGGAAGLFTLIRMPDPSPRQREWLEAFKERWRAVSAVEKAPIKFTLGKKTYELFPTELDHVGKVYANEKWDLFIGFWNGHGEGAMPEFLPAWNGHHAKMAGKRSNPKLARAFASAYRREVAEPRIAGDGECMIFFRQSA